MTLVIVPRTSVTRTFGAISTSISSEPSFTLVMVATMPPAVTTRSLRLSCGQHLAVLLHLLLLRADQQEVEDDEDQDQRQQLHDDAGGAAGTGVLGIGGRDPEGGPHVFWFRLPA